MTEQTFLKSRKLKHTTTKKRRNISRNGHVPRERKSFTTSGKTLHHITVHQKTGNRLNKGKPHKGKMSQ
jgi:hypothetical protein